MTNRFRLLAAAALLLTAGVAQAQTSQTSPAAPAGGRASSPMSVTSPQSPASPVGPPAVDATPSAAAASPPSGAAFTSLTPSPGADAVTVLTQSGQFSTFLKAADATNLTSVLKTPGLTIFAPTDTAFAELPPGTLDTLMKPGNLPQLQKLLAYHLVNTRIPGIKGHAQTQVATAAGAKVTLDGAGDAVKVNDATALQTAVPAGGGATIYPIDKVLSPDFVPSPAETSTDKSTTTTTRKTTRKR